MTSGADITTAAGTIAAAVMACVGLGVSLWINNKDNKRADKQAAEDRARADQRASEDRRAAFDLAKEARDTEAARAAADRAAARDDAQRRHIIDLLLELGRAIVDKEAHHDRSLEEEERNRIVLLLNALPPGVAYLARQKYWSLEPADLVVPIKRPGAVGEKLEKLRLNSLAPKEIEVGHMVKEIAYDIDLYLTSPQPTDKVWEVSPY